MTDLSNSLAAHRETAEAASPGPWEKYDANEDGIGPLWCVANDAFHNPTEDDEYLGVEIHTGHENDATHIAANDPQTALAFNAVVESLERCKSAGPGVAHWCEDCRGYGWRVTGRTAAALDNLSSVLPEEKA